MGVAGMGDAYWVSRFCASTVSNGSRGRWVG